MADPTAPAVSPTGLPVLPPKAVPWAMLSVGVLGAVGGTLVGAPELGLELPAGLVLAGKLLLALTGVVGPMLGLASPGLRRAAPVLLLCLLPLTGCRHDPCRVLSPAQLAFALRASDAVEAKLKAGQITESEAAMLLEMHAADAKMGFPNYLECR